MKVLNNIRGFLYEGPEYRDFEVLNIEISLI